MLATAMLSAISVAPAARAAASRTFVSATGLDTNPCTVSAPCRTFAGALANTSPKGEIYVLDSAGYGPVTINQAVSIINQTSTAAATATAGGAAITINAGATDKVVLRGLTIVGDGSGATGISFNSGGSLTVADSSISGFTFVGIQFQPTSAANLYVSNTRVYDAGGAGINVVPFVASGAGVVRAVFEHVEAMDDADGGIFVDGRASASGVTVRATVADSVLADDLTGTGQGICAITASGQAPVNLMIRNTTISNNATGVAIVGQGASAIIGHSSIHGNNTAFSSTGTLLSYGDNNVDGNGALGATPTTVAFH